METGLYYMRLVAGTGGVETLVSAPVVLPEPAREIFEWRKSVFVRRAEALAGSVVLTGEVQSRCLFSTGAIAERLLCHRAEIPFTVRVPLPRAAPGMDVTVSEAFVSDDASHPIATSPAGLITTVLDQSVLRLRVRAVEPGFVPLPPKGKAKAGPPRRRKKRPQPPAPALSPEVPPEAPQVLPPATDIWVHPSASVPTRSST